MNNHGWLCFLIVLAFVSLSFAFSDQGRARDIYETKLLAIEAENVNFMRALMEENADFIVKEIMLGEIAQCSGAKAKINKALLAYFWEMEKGHSEIAIEFSSNSGKKINLGFMNSHSSFIAKRIGNVCMMEYSFHGGMMRNEFIEAEISGSGTSQKFALPAGYLQRVTGIVA